MSAGGRVSAGVGANLLGQHAAERNQEATCYVGNLEPQVTEEIMWELFVQTGRVGKEENKHTYIYTYTHIAVRNPFIMLEYAVAVVLHSKKILCTLHNCIYIYIYTITCLRCSVYVHIYLHVILSNITCVVVCQHDICISGMCRSISECLFTKR